MTATYFPHTHLFPGDDKTIVISGPHIQVLDSRTGSILHSTAADDFAGARREAVLASGPVRCAAVDRASEHIVTVSDDKRLKVWKINDGLEVLSEREMPKKPTRVLFTADGLTILVADKFGDVHSYPLHPAPAPAQTDDAQTDAELDPYTPRPNAAGGTLVLGHTSLLTSCVLSPDEKYVLTADRDEHIRVSWYPLGYCIESYCLGHTKFVSAIHIPSFAPEILLSGGGDPAIYRWDWRSGKSLGQILVLDVVKPFIKVLSRKRKRGEDDEDEEGPAKPKKAHGRKGRAKNKGKTEEASASGNGEVGSEKMDGIEGKEEAEGIEAAASSVPPSESSADPLEQTLVLRKIQTLEVDGDRLILFCAVGTTALFWCPFDSSDASAVKAHDFGRPVLDIVPAKQSGRVWVLLDAHWSNPAEPTAEAEPSRAVELVQVAQDSITVIDPSAVPLLHSLNTQCLVEASNLARQALELYADLTALPKNVDVAHDPMIRTNDKKNAKEDGKRRTRELLEASQGKASPANTVAVEDALDEGPEIKRAKSEGSHS